MDALRNYVENLFAGMPHTQKALEIKQSMYEDLEEKYTELTTQGRSEEEALGIILKQFGSMNEIKYELGVDDLLEQDTFDMALKAKRRNTYLLVGGIACSFMSIISGVIFSEYLFEDELGAVAFFFFVMLAVICFVLMAPSKRLENLYATSHATTLTNKKRVRFRSFIPLLPAIYLILGFIFDCWHPGWMIFVVYPPVAVVLDKSMDEKQIV